MECDDSGLPSGDRLKFNRAADVLMVLPSRRQQCTMQTGLLNANAWYGTGDWRLASLIDRQTENFMHVLIMLVAYYTYVSSTAAVVMRGIDRCPTANRIT